MIWGVAFPRLIWGHDMTVVCLGDIDQKKFAYIYIYSSFQCFSVCVCVPHAGYIQWAYNIYNGKSGTFLVSFSALSKMYMDPAESQPKYTKQLGTSGNRDRHKDTKGPSVRWLYELECDLSGKPHQTEELCLTSAWQQFRGKNSIEYEQIYQVL